MLEAPDPCLGFTLGTGLNHMELLSRSRLREKMRVTRITERLRSPFAGSGRCSQATSQPMPALSQ